MHFLLLIVGSLFLFALAPLHAAPPNIIVIVADDLGYADVLFNPQHAGQVATPHLDALASQAVVCRQGYVSGNVCSPTRAGLMTGRYQQRLGLYTGGEAGSGLPMSETIFPQFLKPAGYVTGQFGKWHLGPTLEWSPAHRGFDEVFGFLGRGAHDYFKLDDPEDPIYRGTTPVQESGYLTDRLGEETCDFIARHKDKPFFAYLAFNAVHAPLQAPADEVAKFDTGNESRNTLLAMGKRLDDAVGAIVGTLKKEAVWENTLLFFISDNGGPLAQTAVNTPLRGGKHQDYEGGIRVPFLVSWPAQFKPGVSDAVVSALDILPTALAAAGIRAPDDKPFDGINLIPILSGAAPAPARDLFWCNSGDGWWAVRSGDWKLVAERGRIGLFDLSKDISESNDLATAKPDQVAKLTALHDAWLAEMAPPVRGVEKRFTPGAPKKVKPKARNKTAATPPATAAAESDKVHLPFNTLPAKPWKAQRGEWSVKDGAVWVTPETDGEQDALLRGPVKFRAGKLTLDLNLATGARVALRFRDAEGNALFRVEVTPDRFAVIKLGERNELLRDATLTLEPNAWHQLQLIWDGPEFVATFADQQIIITDPVFDQAKSELNLLINGAPAGLRELVIIPAGG